MSKKKSKSKAAKPLSKKDLKKREAALAAELAEREAAAAKKAKKKSGKKAKPAKAAKPAAVDFAALDTEITITAEAEAPVATAPEAAAPDPEPSPEAIIAAAERVLADKNASAGAIKSAKKALAKATAETESDDEIRARVQAKRAARAEKTAAPEYADAGFMSDALEGETEPQYHMRKLRESKEAEAVEKTAAAIDAIKSAVEEVETEQGRVFSAGESVAAETPVEDFAKPSESGPELESGRNGYKIIQLGADGKPDPRKVRQMTRATTFVNNIDDETNLKKWEKRLLAEGISLTPEEFIPTINDLVHRRDVAIAKATKADKKGKLGIGELATLTDRALKEYKTATDAIVEEILETIGRHDKANAGTDLHALAEISDEKGIDAVREMYEREEITATELASIEAYAARMTRLGAKVLHSEAVVVNDEMGYAGRLDRIITARLPELVIGRGTPHEYVRPADQRARRYVSDIKSGSLDFGAGKIARQLAAYALGDLYDLETGERTRHSAARDVALVFHLPQGAGECTVRVVDLKAGAALLKLSGEVRRARNSGKKTIDLTVDVADPEPETAAE